MRELGAEVGNKSIHIIEKMWKLTGLQEGKAAALKTVEIVSD